MWVEGKVLDTEGNPIANFLIDTWETGMSYTTPGFDYSLIPCVILLTGRSILTGEAGTAGAAITPLTMVLGSDKMSSVSIPEQWDMFIVVEPPEINENIKVVILLLNNGPKTDIHMLRIYPRTIAGTLGSA
ncbi:hypothetical protein C8R44DRAFT_747465 [Mycena epipterygia]|nr:hypothetical protein C8R44DRAFT_747465 [Mycena epipterygia]